MNADQRSKQSESTAFISKRVNNIVIGGLFVKADTKLYTNIRELLYCASFATFLLKNGA